MLKAETPSIRVKSRSNKQLHHINYYHNSLLVLLHENNPHLLTDQSDSSIRPHYGVKVINARLCTVVYTVIIM